MPTARVHVSDVLIGHGDALSVFMLTGVHPSESKQVVLRVLADGTPEVYTDIKAIKPLSSLRAVEDE